MKRINYTLDEFQCRRVAIAYPGMGKRERIPWIREQLGILYPGEVEDLKWVYRLKKGTIILYYSEKRTLREIETPPGSFCFVCGEDGEKIFTAPRITARSRRYILLSLWLLLMFFFLIINPLLNKSRWEKENNSLGRVIREEEIASSENITLMNNYEELVRKSALLDESAPPDLYERISLLIPYFNGDFRVLSLTISNDEIQGQAMGHNPLLLIDRMKRDGHFRDIEIEKTDVNSREGYEVFTWKGRFHE